VTEEHAEPTLHKNKHRVPHSFQALENTHTTTPKDALQEHRT